MDNKSNGSLEETEAANCKNPFT